MRGTQYVTSSTMTFTPGTRVVPGVGAVAENIDDLAGLLYRAGRPDYEKWLRHVTPAAGCRYPIRLAGRARKADTATGELVADLDTTHMPDNVLYTACGNRRASVCPSCAETYRGDTFHLVRSGLVGGKGVPSTVTTHPTVFVTLAAPSFGPVHAAHKTGTPCHPRRTPEICPHGVTISCLQRHEPGDDLAGQPFCLDCYDHAGQVVFNSQAGELWRRTRINIARAVDKLGKDHDVRLRSSYAKVAEFQARGVVHFHALIRLDGVDPTDPAAILPPDPSISVALFQHAIHQAAASTRFRTPDHPDQPGGWLMHWGEKSIDTRQVRLSVRDVDDQGAITDMAVAGYLAKYATKATEATGHISGRLTHDTVPYYADMATHPGRLIAACWYLGQCPDNIPSLDDDPFARIAFQKAWAGLHRWAHQLGFGGHFSTKSRRYSTTLTALRAARKNWNRLPEQPPAEPIEPGDEPDILTLGHLTFAGIGWHTSADAQLANSAAAKAREQRRVAREELESLAQQREGR
jgi:hypothetical protein